MHIQWSRHFSIPRSRRDDEPKIKFVKREFGVTTIVYSRKLRKNKVCEKPDFGSGSRLRMGKVLTLHNIRPKTKPLIKCAKVMWFFKIFIFPKKVKIKWCTKETKIIFFDFLGPTRTKIWNIIYIVWHFPLIIIHLSLF